MKPNKFLFAALLMVSTAFARLEHESFNQFIFRDVSTRDLRVAKNYAFDSSIAKDSLIKDKPNIAELAQSLFQNTENAKAALDDDSALDTDYTLVDVISQKNDDLIHEAAKLAKYAYNPSDLVKIRSHSIRKQADNKGREAFADQGHEVFSFSATIEKQTIFGKETAYGQLPAGIITYSTEGGKPTIKLAYHGTECIHDLLTDVMARKVSDPSLLSTGYIHGGFYEKYMASREAMLDIVQGILETHNKTAEQVNFVVTGHSMGGALATIAAVDLKKRFASQDVRLVTFSSPRVFDHAGAAEAEILLEQQALRIWRHYDIVPSLSIGTQFGFGLFTGFKHVGESIRLNPFYAKTQKELGFLGRWAAFMMKNHSMDGILQDIEGDQPVAFTRKHEGFKTRLTNAVLAAGSGAKALVKAGIESVASAGKAFTRKHEGLQRTLQTQL